ncbi:MAG: ABC transporter permease [Actinobacteria bacterium]|nr:ABC transporter permease [Actinomycetota bacterium]
MRKIIAIALKDVTSTYRNVTALVMMLAAPLALAALLGLAFGGNDSGYSVPITRVAFVNQDEGRDSTRGPIALGTLLCDILHSPDLKNLLAITVFTSPADARASVDKGKAAVAVVIPPDFTASITSPDPSATSSIILYADPTQTLGPAIVRGITQEVADAFNGSRAVSAVMLHLAADAGPPPGQNGPNSNVTTEDMEKIILQTTSAYIQATQEEGFSGTTARGPQVDHQAKDPGIEGLVLSGMMVFFMFIGGANIARSIIDEDAQGTLPRLFTTPTRRSVILGGKMVSVFLTVLTQAIILLLAGGLLFGIDWGGVVPVALLTLNTALVSAGLAVFLVSLMKTPAQAGAITSGVFVTLALLGGNFVGSMPIGGLFSTIRRLTPNGWLLEGWDKVLRGAEAHDILLQLSVAMAFAAVTFVAGSLIFRRRFS